MTYQLPFSDVLIPVDVLLNHLLELLRDEAVDGEHGQPELSAQLSHVLQQRLHLTLVLSLHVRNLKKKNQVPSIGNISAFYFPLRV